MHPLAKEKLQTRVQFYRKGVQKWIFICYFIFKNNKTS
jgi:hypothetical protein